METLLLLARASPLPQQFDLNGLLRQSTQRLPAIRAGAWWFQKGELRTLRDQRPRAPDLAKTKLIAEPLLQMQRRLANNLQPHFDLVQAVSFPFQNL
jgi:hypothetical protein